MATGRSWSCVGEAGEERSVGVGDCGAWEPYDGAWEPYERGVSMKGEEAGGRSFGQTQQE
jgi:hypothetical protein